MKLILLVIFFYMIGCAQNNKEKEMRNFKEYKTRLDFVLYEQPNSHYGSCERCGLQWKYCKEHSVMMSERVGMFALCNYCWDECTEEERIFYYTELYKKLQTQYPDYADPTIRNLQTLIKNIKEESEND